ncbi:MAG: DNA mismatch repair endonuclease MutL [Kiritimatiellaeota bacterium]|nr:DNA mismatch repair endonuclease MutL [Kiritimatiellota bacterium]
MAGPRHILVLSDQVISQIAAGEVVDRPASVVKELIENALDAGATQIDIEVTDGGRQVIAVADNGCGMGPDDALLSIERHATSKIRDVADIERIQTLGFRGEALAAIAAVAHFTLTTRPAAALAGTEVTLAGGKLLEVKEAGCPAGTRIQVRRLFFNVPARRKFLRSDQTELAHIRQVLVVYALAHPAVGLRLVVDGREVYRLAAGATLPDRLREVLGAELARLLRPVSFQGEEVTVTGGAGLPAAARQDRSGQYVFINGRPAGAPVLSHALSEAYRTLLPPGRYPPVFLFLTMDPALVDVNVHPTKKEVRFRHPGQVRDALIAALRGALQPPAPAPGGPGGGEAARPAPAAETQRLLITDLPDRRAFSYPRLPMIPPAAGADGAEPADRKLTTPGMEGQRPDVPSGPPPDSRPAPWSWCRVLGQVGGLYVVLETEDGLVLMDPHAAHERVLYEQFMRQVLARQVRSQGLLAPESVELMPREVAVINEHRDVLRQMGFGLAEFGGAAFIVDALPACLGNASARSVLAAVAETLQRGGARGGAEHWAEEAVAQAACKAAVKARDTLRLDEIEKLVVALAGTEMPYTCPHGRPTIIFMSFDELNRKFGRA